MHPPLISEAILKAPAGLSLRLHEPMELAKAPRKRKPPSSIDQRNVDPQTTQMLVPHGDNNVPQPTRAIRCEMVQQ